MTATREPYSVVETLVQQIVVVILDQSPQRCDRRGAGHILDLAVETAIIAQLAASRRPGIATTRVYLYLCFSEKVSLQALVQVLS